MTYAIEANALVKRFGPVTALDGVDLEVPAGSVRGLLGPNGAGKSTAVRILATLLRPDSGSARVGGIDVFRRPGDVRKIIGVTGQDSSVDDDLTGRHNLTMFARLSGLRGSAARRRADELLADAGLTDAAGRQVKTYSGGRRRRRDLAASRVNRPAVLFLDEPTTGLDPGRRADIWRTVRALVAEGTTVLLTTQYMEEADVLADDVVVIDHGRVIAHGTPADLKERSGAQTLDEVFLALTGGTA